MNVEKRQRLQFPKFVEVNREAVLGAYRTEMDGVKKRKLLKVLRRPAKEGLLKRMSREQKEHNRDRMKELGTSRQELNKAYNDLGEVFATHAQASNHFERFLINYDSNPGILKAFARDGEGLARRRQLEEQGFQVSGGAGKFRPYYVQNGILRGGLTGRGLQVGNNYAIPVQPNGDERVLQSMIAKYTNPNKFPSTRLIKFVRGHWGINPGTTQHEAIWEN